MGCCMKTTIELPDDLFIEAKKAAAEGRTTIKAIVERGLRQELRAVAKRGGKRPAIRWVTVAGGVAEGLDVADREQMAEWLGHDRD